MNPDFWHLMLGHLCGEPVPELPVLPGRRIVAFDAPLTADELAGITSCAELALVLGISRQAAHQRLQKRRATVERQT